MGPRSLQRQSGAHFICQECQPHKAWGCGMHQCTVSYIGSVLRMGWYKNVCKALANGSSLHFAVISKH